ncbi:helix-turn-helix domain-containing protein [Rhodococcus erythropolis]|uniref:helix-turn-helix domain-containing protein n=1 Tax=Rhodococcus erythropolis TaxID=1833 RepID=UPI003671CC7E
MSRNEKSQESIPTWLVREEDRERFAKEVGPARRSQGITQEELAEMSGISKNTIGNIERGATVPQAAKLLPLLRFLGIGPAALSLRPVVAEQMNMISGMFELLPDDDVPAVGAKVTRLILNEVHRLKSTDNVVPMRPWNNAPTYDPNYEPDFSEYDAASHGEKETIPENGLESP